MEQNSHSQALRTLADLTRLAGFFAARLVSAQNDR
jgi:hypothetical protein